MFRAIALIATMFALVGCTQPQWLADANARFEQRMNEYPGGGIGAGLDMIAASQQIRAMRGR